MCFRPAAVEMSNKCPQCGCECALNLEHCPQCGAALPKVPAMPGMPGAPGVPVPPGAPALRLHQRPVFRTHERCA